VELYLHSPYGFSAWYLVKHRDNFAFTFSSLRDKQKCANTTPDRIRTARSGVAIDKQAE